eukprot:3399613-Prymnesium_polylepis.1
MFVRLLLKELMNEAKRPLKAQLEAEISNAVDADEIKGIRSAYLQREQEIEQEIDVSVRTSRSRSTSRSAWPTTSSGKAQWSNPRARQVKRGHPPAPPRRVPTSGTDFSLRVVFTSLPSK